MKLIWLVLLSIVTSVLVFWGFSRMAGKDSDISLIKPKPIPLASDYKRLEPLKVKVSIPYWDQRSALASFRENIDLVDYVSLFWYFLGSDGKVHKYNYAKEDLSIVNLAHDNGVKVEVVITNLPEDGGWDSERVERVLRNGQLRQKHIEEIVVLAQRIGVEGIDIDYEQLDDDLKDDFSKFIQDLGKALRGKGKYLGVALHPKSDDGIGATNGSLSQDWPAIAEGADNLYIMAFGEHWDEEGPGPVASLPWVERIIRYAQSLGIDKRKLFLTIPLFGYDWRQDSEEDAKGLTYSDVTKLLNKYNPSEEWDESNSSPHFHYENRGGREVWYENARSVKEKIKLAEDSGFAGVTFWRLGGEDPQIWKEISSVAKK